MWKRLNAAWLEELTTQAFHVIKPKQNQTIKKL